MRSPFFQISCSLFHGIDGPRKGFKKVSGFAFNDEFKWILMAGEFRALETADLKAVHAIESKVYDDPWTLQLFQESLTAPMTYSDGLFLDLECIGYAIYQVIFGESHLLNIAILPNHQKQGYGQKTLDHVVSKVKKLGASSLYLEVRPSNVAAIKLYEKNGFRLLMKRERYYSNGEPALVMVMTLSSKS